MWSSSISALLPSSVTICPLTDTRPLVISSSALRREAIPAAAMIFCSRSAGMRLRLLRRTSGFGFGGVGSVGGHCTVAYEGVGIGAFRNSLGHRFRFICLRNFECMLGAGPSFFRSGRGEQVSLRIAQLFEFLHAGQLGDVVESEAEQKFLGRLVENGAADDLLAPGSGDQLAIKQGGDYAGSIHAANLADLRYRDRLLVGDDSERFQCLQRKAHRRLQALRKIDDHIMMLGLSRHAIAARDLPNLHAAFAGGVLGRKLVNDAAEPRFDGPELFLGFGLFVLLAEGHTLGATRSFHESVLCRLRWCRSIVELSVICQLVALG